MAPACAATSAASAATAISAGSATVVAKPRQNAEASSAVALPLRANPCAIASPSGNRPLSRPWIKSVRPTITHNSPTTMLPRSGKGCCSTTIWKKAMTTMIGARSRRASARRRTRTARALVIPPPSWCTGRTGEDPSVEIGPQVPAARERTPRRYRSEGTGRTGEDPPSVSARRYRADSTRYGHAGHEPALTRFAAASCASVRPHRNNGVSFHCGSTGAWPGAGFKHRPSLHGAPQTARADGARYRRSSALRASGGT